MVRPRVLLGSLAAVLVVGAAVTTLGLRAASPPRPSLPYPAGLSLSHVRGNCSSGNELLGCDSRSGPRSFLDVSAAGDVRDAGDALFAAMTARGWRVDQKGLVATDFGSGPDAQPEDIQPVFCKTGSGCVGMFRYERAGFVLAWWEAPPADGA